jgi:amino acid transporter
VAWAWSSYRDHDLFADRRQQVVIAAAETANPLRSIPKATKRVTYRICFFYVIGALLIGMIVPYNDPNLASGSGNANSSPFVIAIKNAGIPVLGSVVNVSLTCPAYKSQGDLHRECETLTPCYIGARIIVAMAVDRQLPQCFSRVNKRGVPYYAVIASFLFGPLAYLSERLRPSRHLHRLGRSNANNVSQV